MSVDASPHADGALATDVGCTLARSRFALQRTALAARVAGKPVRLDEALVAAADHLATARRLLVTGLGLDVAGARAAVRLAQRHDALLDHRAGAAARANQRVFERRGWITTTYSEARNHGDVFLLVATDGVSANPRFVERIAAPAHALFAPVAARRVLHLGPRDDALAEKLAPLPVAARVEAGDGALLAALTAIGGALRHGSATDPALAPVVAALREARYAVVVWEAATLPPAHAEMIVEAIIDLVAAANLTTRCAGLPLARDASFTTANQVATWLTGFALPVVFIDGDAHHDPARHSASRWLADGTADLVVSIDAWAGMPRVASGRAKEIVIAPALDAQGKEPEVFVPVAIPGRDVSGHFCRGDGVVSLHVRPVAPSPILAVAQAIAGISAHLAARAAA